MEHANRVNLAYAKGLVMDYILNTTISQLGDKDSILDKIHKSEKISIPYDVQK